MSPYGFFAVTVCFVLANVVTIQSGYTPPVLQDVINECDLTPAPGSCINRRPIEIWTFSRRTQTCQRIFGCYTFGDRNVFRNRVDCRDTCGIQSIVECDAIPQRVICRRPRKYWTYRRRLGRCKRIRGCYRTSDQNVFRRRRECRETCNRSPIYPDIGSSTIDFGTGHNHAHH